MNKLYNWKANCHHKFICQINLQRASSMTISEMSYDVCNINSISVVLHHIFYCILIKLKEYYSQAEMLEGFPMPSYPFGFWDLTNRKVTEFLHC